MDCPVYFRLQATFFYKKHRASMTQHRPQGTKFKIKEIDLKWSQVCSSILKLGWAFVSIFSWICSLFLFSYTYPARKITLVLLFRFTEEHSEHSQCLPRAASKPTILSPCHIALGLHVALLCCHGASYSDNSCQSPASSFCYIRGPPAVCAVSCGYKTEQDPKGAVWLVPPYPHVLSLPFVSRKTLFKE